jgi:hypothetical protein
MRANPALHQILVGLILIIKKKDLSFFYRVYKCPQARKVGQPSARGKYRRKEIPHKGMVSFIQFKTLIILSLSRKESRRKGGLSPRIRGSICETSRL